MDHLRQGLHGSSKDQGKTLSENVAESGAKPPQADYFRQIFEASPTPLTVLAPPDWTIVAVNDARLELTGSIREDLIGRKLFELYPEDPNDPEASGMRNVSASFDRVLATKAPDTMAVQRYSVRGPTGEFVERWWSPLNSPVLDGQGEVALIIHQVEEVTDIVRMRGEAEAADQLARDQQQVIARLQSAEAALRRNEGRLGAAIAISRLGTFDWNLSTGAVELDARAREILGFGAFEGHSDAEVFARIHPADLAHVQEKARKSQQSRERLEIEYRVQLADGTIRIVRSINDTVAGSDGQAQRMVGVFEDVTERHAAQQSLRESEERSRRIIEGVRDYAVFTTDLDGMVTDWTPGAEAIFGWSQEDIVRVNCSVLFTPEDQAADRPRQELQTARDEGCANDERWHMRRDGSRFFANGSVRPLHGEEGRMVGFIKIARDETARRVLDDRLRASEELNRRVLASSADCIKVLDLDARVQFMSEGGMCAMEVDNFADIEGQEWPGFWLGDERAKAEQALLAAKNGGVGRFQGFATTIKGRPRWWDVIVTPIAGPDGRPKRLLSVSRDITGARQAEDQLRASEARYRALFTSLDVGFCVIEMRFDDEGHAVDYRFVEVNPAFVHQTDLVHAVGRWMREIAPNHEQRWFDLYGCVALTGDPARFEEEAAEFGRWYEIHAFRTGDPQEHRVAVLFNDISARRRAEKGLQELNENLEAQVAERTAERDRMWRLSTDLMLVADFDGVVRSLNPAWKKLLGWAEADLISTNFLALVHPDDQEVTIGEMGKLDQGITTFRFENRYRAKAGDYRWISWTAVPENSFIHAVGRDITAERVAAAELEAAQEALRQSQKMEAMGQLTGGVAHDFNNLLTPIVGGLDMLQRKGLGGEREQRLIAGAVKSADRAKTLVQRLLAFARRQPLQATAVDVGELVTGMADLVASTSGPQIKVVVERPEAIPPAKADANQLEMALLNLGVNARDAMPDGGTLRITASAERIEAGHRSKLKAGDYVRLSVADTGVGMDAETVKRAVEPFFSTKGVGKGTGLGLSMVHGLASQLGGALTIDSRPEVGTNVELWLPVSEVPAEPNKSAPNEVPLRTVQGTALLVDDEELVRISTADMLGDIGYQVVEAASAEKALVLLDEGLRPDLLVTDHLMPGMNGTDLAHAVLSNLPGTRILIVSGYAETDGVDASLPRLTKPFRNADLAAKLSELASK